MQDENDKTDEGVVSKTHTIPIDKYGRMNVTNKVEKDYSLPKFYDTFLMDFNMKYSSDSLKVSSEGEIELCRNQLHATIPVLGKEWTVSLEINPSELVAGWTNVLHCGLGGNWWTYGDRMPAIWFYSNSTCMCICSAINDYRNFWTKTEAIPLNEWTKVEITHTPQSGGNYLYKIIVDGKVIREVANDKAREFEDIKVYTSDDWYAAPKASIRNLRIRTYPENPGLQANEIKLIRDTIHDTIPVLYKQWTVSFDIKFTKTYRWWSTALRVGTGGNYGGMGDCMPQIWVYPNDTRFYIRICRNGAHNFSLSTDSIGLNQWTKLKLTHLRKNTDSETCVYKVWIGEKLIAEYDCETDLRDYKDVKVYTSGPHYNAAKAVMRNLRVCTFPIDEMPEEEDDESKKRSIFHVIDNGGYDNDGHVNIALVDNKYINVDVNGQTFEKIAELPEYHYEGLMFYKMSIRQTWFEKEKKYWLTARVIESEYGNDWSLDRSWKKGHYIEKAKIYENNAIRRNLHYGYGRPISSLRLEEEFKLTTRHGPQRKEWNMYDELELKKDYLYDTLPIVYKQWSFSVDIQPHEADADADADADAESDDAASLNVVHLGLGGNNLVIGDSMPAIFLDSSKQLTIAMPLNDDKSFSTNGSILKSAEWTKVEIIQFRQADGRYQLKISEVHPDPQDSEKKIRKVLRQIINQEPREFQDVKVYASGKHHEPAKAKIKNLCIAVFPDEKEVWEQHREITLIPSNIYDTIPILFKQWSFTVEINPSEAVEKYGNLCRVGLGGNFDELGDHEPSLGFLADSTKLSINCAIDDKINHEYNCVNDIPLGEWTKVEITQFRQPDGTYIYKIVVGGEEMESVTHVPREYYNVKVQTCDNYQEPAKAKLRDLRISTFP